MENRKITYYYRKYAWLFIVGAVADIAVDAIRTFVPEFLGEIVEIVSTKPDVVFADVSNIIMNMLTIALIMVVGQALLRFTILYASGRIEADIRHEMFLKAERLSQRYYHERIRSAPSCRGSLPMWKRSKNISAGARS